MIAAAGDIEIMNPKHAICHLDPSTRSGRATLNMELTADIGKGYVAAAANRPADAPIGLIPVDALYSPVRQVSKRQENTRLSAACKANAQGFIRQFSSEELPIKQRFEALGDHGLALATSAGKSTQSFLEPVACFTRAIMLNSGA